MQTLILLHGALGAADQLEPLKQLFSHKYSVYTLNFSGHGGVALPSEAFSISLFAKEVMQYIEDNKFSNVNIFGYSMGGYVAMYIAKYFPGNINKIITLATKFHWDETIAARETKMLDPVLTETKVPAFATALSKRHEPNDWKDLMHRTAAMLTNLGKKNTLQPDDYKDIQIPCLLLIGDRDKMITLSETVDTYGLLPNAQMGMLPDTGHPVEKVNVGVLERMVDWFLG